MVLAYSSGWTTAEVPESRTAGDVSGFVHQFQLFIQRLDSFSRNLSLPSYSSKLARFNWHCPESDCNVIIDFIVPVMVG